MIAIDWEQFGLGPTGFDLGYLLLAADLPLDDLLVAYAATGEPVDLRAVRRGAIITATYTAISRATWSLTQPEPGDHLTRLTRLSDLVFEAAA